MAKVPGHSTKAFLAPNSPKGQKSPFGHFCAATRKAPTPGGVVVAVPASLGPPPPPGLVKSSLIQSAQSTPKYCRCRDCRRHERKPTRRSSRAHAYVGPPLPPGVWHLLADDARGAARVPPPLRPRVPHAVHDHPGPRACAGWVAPSFPLWVGTEIPPRGGGWWSFWTWESPAGIMVLRHGSVGD